MSQYVCLLLVLGGDPNCGDYFHFVRQFQNYLIICEVGLKRNKVAITSKCVWLWGSDDIWPSPISHNSHYDWNALFHEHFVWKASILLKRKELFEARPKSSGRYFQTRSKWRTLGAPPYRRCCNLDIRCCAHQVWSGWAWLSRSGLCLSSGHCRFFFFFFFFFFQLVPLMAVGLLPCGPTSSLFCRCCAQSKAYQQTAHQLSSLPGQPSDISTFYLFVN